VDGGGRPNRTDQQRAGDAAEELVASRLIAAGWTVVARNVHVGRAEIDVVAVDAGPPPALVILEVRWRRSREFGLPEETVDWRKRRHLRIAALALLDRGLPDGSPVPHLPLRFDLVVVEPPLDGRAEPRVRHHRHVIGD
jgi:putative endonuclease